MASRTDSRQRRFAVITVELLLMLPILLILLAAIVEFGLIFSVTQNVAFASRYGVKLASEQGSPASALSVVTNGQLRSAIDRHLETAGITHGTCRITLEQNNGGFPGSATDAPGGGACDCATPLSSLPMPGTALRLTICVPLENNIPDLLSSFGFSLNNKYVQESTTLRLE